MAAQPPHPDADHRLPITNPMTLLPVVERELRVKARRASTYWTRALAASGMMGVWFLLLFANRRSPAEELSHTLFIALGAWCLIDPRAPGGPVFFGPPFLLGGLFLTHWAYRTRLRRIS